MNSPANSTFWAFLRFETVKMFHRRITWVPFGVIVIVVALVVAVFHYSDFKTQLTFLKAMNLPVKEKKDFVNGYLMAVATLNPVSQILLPLFIAVAAGLMIAGEAEGGTLRACLIRPVSRTRLILGKFIVLGGYGLLLSYFYLGLVLTAGLINFGRGDLYLLNVFFNNGREGYAVITPDEAPYRFLLAGLLLACGMMVLASLAILVSALSRTAAMAYVISLSIYNIFLTLRALQFLEWLYPYLFVTHMLRWQQCFSENVQWGEIYVSLVHLAAYLAVFLCSAVLLFEEKDVTS